MRRRIVRDHDRARPWRWPTPTGAVLGESGARPRRPHSGSEDRAKQEHQRDHDNRDRKHIEQQPKSLTLGSKRVQHTRPTRYEV